MKNWNTMILFGCCVTLMFVFLCHVGSWEVKKMHYMFEKTFRGVVGLAAIGLVEKCGTNH